MRQFYTKTKVAVISMLLLIVGSSFTAKAQQYTLTDADVVVSNGVITSCSYNFIVKDIIIPETLDGQTVHSIGTSVFKEKGIINVKLPNTLTAIHQDAFRANKLTEVIIPNNVTSIGKYAFAYNTINNLTLSNKLTTLGNDAFGYNKLKSVTLPNTLKTIGDYAFEYNTLTSIIIPNEVTYIGFRSFQHNNLTSVTIGNKVNSIGSYAFASNKITNIIIPNSVTSIGNAAFINNRLATVKISNNINSIPSETFRYNRLTEVTIPNNVTEIHEKAFADNKLTSVTIPGSVELIQAGVFADNSTLTNITLPVPNSNPNIKWLDNTNTTYAGGTNVSDFNTYYILDREYTLTNDDVVVSNGVITSCSYSFKIKKIIIPETLDDQTVTSIGTSVFREKGIINAKLPNTLTAIHQDAFRANKLTEVIIPNNVTSIGKYAFAYNTINNLTLSNKLTTLGNDAFGYNKLKSVTLPNTLKTIGDYAFEYNTLTSIIIPNEVTYIGFRSFQHNNITSVTIGDKVNSIGSYAFASNKITNIIIPNSVTSIGNAAFINNRLATVKISNNINSIPSETFRYNRLTEVIIPNNVTEIHEKAFADNKLTSVTIPGSVELIQAGAFADNSTLTHITLPIPNSNSNIKWLDNTNTTYAGGTNVSDFNTYYILDREYTLTNDDVVVSNGVITSCSYSFKIKKIIIPETLDDQTVTSIGTSVFREKGIIKVKLPNTLTAIHQDAFRANKLTEVIIPNNVTSIGKYAFAYNTINNLTLSNKLTTLGNDAFGYNKLKSVTLPNTLKTIGDYAFEYNTLTSIIIPNEVTYIGLRSFQHNNLTSVTIGDKVNSIGSYAFASNKITNIIIPNSVTSIGNAAFINNRLATVKISNNINSIPSETFRYNRLTEVTIPNNVTEIQENAFADNSKLTSITLPEINTEGYNFINWIDSENNIHEANSQVSNFAIGYNANLEIIKCTINGVVKGADGVAIAITGDITDNKTLNNNDNYSLTLNYGQSVEITATKDGEVFENATYTINNIKENKNSCNFITVYNLSGTITGTNGVTLTMSGDASDSKTVNSGDTYNFTVKYNQNVEIIPSKEGYTFAPEKYTLTDINKNIDSKDFVATIKKYTISGIVNGADGVTVTMSGDASANKTVDNGDIYSFTVNHGQSVTITATKDGQVFATNKYAFDDVKENKTDCNFTTVYTVSGTVSGADGVVVELSGDVSAKKVLNSGDTYEFTAQYNQSITVKASKPGYKFEPATYEFNNIKENSANNHFVGTIKQYTISGIVDGADAVTVTMSGDASDSKTVNSGDTYNFAVNHGQNVTITATKEGYTFAKDTYSFSNVIENRTDVNFKAAINTYTISGTVDGADNVTVTMSGDASDSKTVNSGDTYNFTVNHGQNVNITATKEGYTFSKATYSLSNITDNKTDINFEAIIITYTVQFNIKSEGNAVNNCTVKFNGKDYTTNADGLVTINNIKPGDYSYTVTANGYKEQTGDIKVINKDITKSIVLIKDDKALSVDLLDSKNYSLYPNPAKDIITLKSNSTISRVTIISISGAVVKVNTDECNEAHINISDIKPGIYILRAQTKDGLIIKRFIKQ